MSSMTRSIRRRWEWTPKRPRSQKAPVFDVNYKEVEERLLAQVLAKTDATRKEDELYYKLREILMAYGNVAVGAPSPTGRSSQELLPLYYPTRDGWKRYPSD